MLSIGDLARESGLSVSSLRYYDKVGVLVPHTVDPHTGYRRYTFDQVDQARLVAGMRGIGLPVREMVEVLRGDDPHGVLAAHVRRLERALDEARSQTSRLHSLITDRVTPTSSATVSAGALAAAVESVLYACDPHSPFAALRGVLVECDGTALRLVATDRYRMAVTEVAAPGSDEFSTLVPSEFLRTAVHDHLPGPGVASLSRRADTVTLSGPAGIARATALPETFPDYRVVLAPRPGTVGELDRDRVRRASTAETVSVRCGAGGRVRLAAPGVTGGADDTSGPQVLVPARHLREAVDALPGGRLTVTTAGPWAPVELRAADAPGTVSLLMPVADA
ncbi:MerR family transcriptional regulator [Rhodococcus triatomae]|uniref:DNA-binding transcriptional regulator, MerR family n=1 Tax=Rhodococcus triatomae TaxID=300028 RepID=A0A1G8NB09_9NOCA|nr:MerR family transcriptional regulator [Rhodococcus triatomae]QNG19952.1 MerR family transcriptional regulator [Rhodococcus triatomae]QNG24133.1 MerR family transcriptional regulator [Rhodococcus triatomae]SDI77257.1 DNA-binding transcriptional regulator, MerR family [Rhodococcus triatomae]